MKKIVAIGSILFSLTGLFGQEIKDSVQLDEMIYSGHVSPQEMNQTVYEVQVISKEEIEQSAAITLADLLNQTLNIQVIPSNNTGKSGLSMFGLNSQYVKILVDNVPILNDEGLGNFTDLTQINLTDIEQIEIVEGAMGVDYGADAVTGVINIITQKKSKENVSAQLFVQEETIGDEYELFRKGRHIKGLDIKAQPAKNLSVGINFNQNDFRGFFNGKKGENYDQNDSLRGHDWLPKQQYDVKTFASYKWGTTNIFYRFNYFKEEIQRYNQVIQPNYQPQTDTYHPTAQDTEFSTDRNYHLLNLNGKAWKNADYSLSFSFQEQKRNANFYTYNILDESVENENKFDFESRKTYYSKGLVSQTLQPNWSWQLGYEVNQVSGVQSPLARSFDTSVESIERDLGSYDLFTSTDIKLKNGLMIRPGLRALFSNHFDAQLAYSLSASYLFNNNWEIRAIYGNAPKNPTYEQLFTYFVDSNHYVVGNEHLESEKGQSVFVHIKKKNKWENLVWKNKLSGWYLYLQDQIDLIVINTTPLEYEFTNFDNFTQQGFAFQSDLSNKNWSALFGVNYSGAAYESNGQDMLYTWKANLAATYRISDWNLILFTSLKYNGEEYQYLYNINDDGEEEIIKGKQEDYVWWDASVKKPIGKQWEVVLGARNLANVVRIRTSADSAEAHSVATTENLLGYGRSYFLKLSYKIPF